MRSLKKEVIHCLENKQYESIVNLSPSVHKITNILISLSYDKSQTISWRAIEAVGIISRETAKTDPETVRNIVGRLLWMIRDESGGIGWSCPEMLGEIVRNSPDLFADVAPVIASFHDEKMLVSGVLWALGRMGRINDDVIGRAILLTLPYLQSEDQTLRGYAAFALGELGALGAVPKLKQITGDVDSVNFYENGELNKTTVGEIARRSLERIGDI